jgi:hypothetical protein
MATPSILIVPDRYKSGVLYSQLPETGAVDFGVTRATPAFRTNASGILDSTASGVPRLDYPAAGGCPALLVEPAATNLVTFSEDFTNAAWLKINATVNANTHLAPDNTNTADEIVFLSNGIAVQNYFVSVLINDVYVISVFTKSTTRKINFGGATPAGVDSYEIVSYSNGWYRQIVKRLFTNTGAQIQLVVLNEIPSSAGTSIFWGAQLETGSVATSYIPTTSAAVTRNADVISKTGVSGFIGQTVGTLYAEVDVRNFQTDGRILAISNGTSDNRIALLKGANSTLRGLVTTASGSVADIATASGQTAGVYKIALAYAADDFVLYVNGSQIGTDTSGAVPACTDVYLGKIETSGTTNQLNDRIRAAAIYTTRLSNTELAALTSL